ncbi:MAG: hypothetical protein JO144_14020 [Actinobacteria bacterium]|nr:hypothetical protein [Actinomycetota bacterium]
MSEPDSTNGKNGVKTLGIRFQPALHTQLSVIAQLRGHSIQDEVIAAVEAHVEQAKADPELLGRIQAAIADIDRDAASRRDALAALFSTAEPTAEAAGEAAGQPAPPDGGGKPSGQRRVGRATSS